MTQTLKIVEQYTYCVSNLGQHQKRLQMVIEIRNEIPLLFELFLNIIRYVL